jgi:hypothetical protein
LPKNGRLPPREPLVDKPISMDGGDRTKKHHRDLDNISENSESEESPKRLNTGAQISALVNPEIFTNRIE